MTFHRVAFFLAMVVAPALAQAPGKPGLVVDFDRSPHGFRLADSGQSAAILLDAKASPTVATLTAARLVTYSF